MVSNACVPLHFVFTTCFSCITGHPLSLLWSIPGLCLLPWRPSPSQICILQAKGPKAALMVELGLWCICWKQWFLTMAVRGKERLHLPPPDSHLPPPTSHLPPAAFGRGPCLAGVWVGDGYSSPPPFLFPPLPALSRFPYLLPSSLLFSLPPFPLLSFLPLPTPFSSSLPPPLSLLLLPLPPSRSTSRQCKPLAEELEGHKEVQKEKTFWCISKYYLPTIFYSSIFILGSLSF